MDTLKDTDHISMESTNNEFLPQMILAAIEGIGYRISQLVLGPIRSTMIIAHPDIILHLGTSWEQYPHFIGFFPDKSMTNKAYVLTTHLNMERVLDHPRLNWEEFLDALQNYFDGNPTPIVVKAPWVQAILIVNEEYG